MPSQCQLASLQVHHFLFLEDAVSRMGREILASSKQAVNHVFPHSLLEGRDLSTAAGAFHGWAPSKWNDTSLATYRTGVPDNTGALVPRAALIKLRKLVGLRQKFFYGSGGWKSKIRCP